MFKNKFRLFASEPQAPDRRQLKEENEKEHSTGMGISLNDFLDQFDESFMPDITESVTFKGCRSFELVTDLICKDRAYLPEDEAAQYLVVSADGTVRFRTNTYNKGRGKLGIGRIEEAHIEKSVFKEICSILEAWLYTKEDAPWQNSFSSGRWIIRVRRSEGEEQIKSGSLGSAVYAQMDISDFIRDRIPIEKMYLFDNDTQNHF